jgi:K+-transporting ATPase ATPase B chain
MEVAKSNKRMPVSTMLDPKIMMPAIVSAFAKLDPRLMIKSPVMFVVEIVAALTTVIFLRDLVTGGENLAFTFQIILWLWFTVLFANFAEAVAEGRGKAQAETLRKTRTESQAKLLTGSDKAYRLVPGTSLKIGDLVLVEAGDNIPSDGEVIEGVASVNEAAITGESAPVIRESGGDRSAVTGGTQVLSDWIRVRITAAQGSTFIDRMIKLVEGAERQKTPNEIALNILLAGLTIIFVFATVTIPSYAAYAGGSISVVVLVALFVTLIPPPSARYCPRSASPAWTVWFVSTSWRCQAGRSRPPVTSTRCCSTRPGPSRSATARLRHFSQSEASPSRNWRTRRNSPRWPMKPRRVARLSCWQRKNTAFAAAT